MKKSWIFILVVTFTCIAVVLVVSLQFLPVEKLLRPPKQNGENAIIQEVFENNVSQGYTLKVAVTGKYDTAYNFANVDNDTEDEVIVTYCEPESGDNIKLCILDKDGGKWQFLSEFLTEQNEIEFIDFLDIDSDCENEIVLGMSTKGILVTKRLNVYDINTSGESESVDLFYECDYAGVKITDINGDGNLEIIRADIITGENCHKLSVLKHSDGKIKPVCSVNVNKNLKTLTSIEADSVFEKDIKRIYLDGYIVDGTMSTICYAFESNKNELYEINGGEKYDALSISRKIYVNCKDIDGDGLIEFPLQTQLNDSEIISSDYSDLFVDTILWSRMYEDKSEVVLYHIINNIHKYTVAFDPDWYDRFTYVMNADTGMLTFYTLDSNYKRSESILAIAATHNEFKQHTKIYENRKRKYYLIMYDYALSKGFTVDKVKEYIIF